MAKLRAAEAFRAFPPLRSEKIGAATSAFCVFAVTCCSQSFTAGNEHLLACIYLYRRPSRPFIPKLSGTNLLSEDVTYS